MSKEYKVKDGGYEIFFSGSFNVYEKLFAITNIEGINLEIKFVSDPSKEDFPIEYRGDLETKTIYVNLYNWENNNPLGIGTINPLPVFDLVDNKKVFISIHSKMVNSMTSLKILTITLSKR